MDSDKKTPVIATTVDLLSTGVDVPSLHNIVFLRPIASKVLLKQIVGRGSRIDPNTKKFYFRIIDYVDATRLLDDWDSPEEPESATKLTGAMDYYLAGNVVSVENGEGITNAMVTVAIGPNQRQHTRTDLKGYFAFEGMPRVPVKLQISSGGFLRTEILTLTTEGKETSVHIELKPEPPKKEKVTIEGLNVFVAEETYIEIEEGKILAKASYIEYSKEEVKKRVLSLEDLKKIWLRKIDRDKLLGDLKDKSVNPNVIGKLIERPDADTFDIIAHVAFGAPIISRDERASALLNLKAGFIESFGPEAKQSLLDLLDKYRLGGTEEISSPEVFRVPPFDKRGYIMGVAKQFGGIEGLKRAVEEIQRGLYFDIEHLSEKRVET
jgi:type I restriction enzyme R subunit